MVYYRRILTEVQKRIIACAQNYMCVGEICNSVTLLPRTWELDHIIPLSKDGTNKPDNLQIICPNCHALKTQKELMSAAKLKRDERIRIQHTTHRYKFDRMKSSSIKTIHQQKRPRMKRSTYSGLRSPYFNPNHQKLAFLKLNLPIQNSHEKKTV
jgi:hypothetical protein